MWKPTKQNARLQKINQPRRGWAGARTFQSAATLECSTGPRISPALLPFDAAADWKVRAPAEPRKHLPFTTAGRFFFDRESGRTKTPEAGPRLPQSNPRPPG